MIVRFVRSLFVVTLLTPYIAATAQKPSREKTLDLSGSYIAQRTNYVGGSNLWMSGGSLEAGYPGSHGISAVFNLMGVNGNGNSGFSGLGILSYMAGPRYTITLPHNRWTGDAAGTHIYGEGLFGLAHGFNSTFPTPTSATSTANSFAFLLGGGIEFDLKHRLTIRPIELDYFRSKLPNGANGAQHQLRIGAGIVYHLPLAHNRHKQ